MQNTTVKKTVWLALLGAQLLIILTFWSWNQTHHPLGNLLTGGSAGQLLAYGRLAGLLAAFLILLQVFLIGPIRWTEQTFGLDRMTRLHHVLGFSLLALLAAHPLLVTLGHAGQEDNTFMAQYLDFLRNWPGVLAAAIGLGIMLAAVAFSVAIVRKRLKYETWQATHLTLYVAMALAFGHQLEVGNDFTGNRGFAGYWQALYIAVFGNLIWHRLLRPLVVFNRHRFAIARVTPESSDVTSLEITGRNLERLRAAGGQFVLVRFWAKGFRWEKHPFSLSCRPDGHRLRLTIKQLGDFTRRVPQLAPGTPVILDGPHGIFTARRSQAAKVLLIAGGIGITPIRAIAEELLEAGRDLLLIYGNRHRDGIVFKQELDALATAAGGRFRIVHVLNNDPGWPGEKGKIDRERILRLAPDIRERDVYLCGPPPMMKLIRADLTGAGVPPRRIYDERFAL